MEQCHVLTSWQKRVYKQMSGQLSKSNPGYCVIELTYGHT